MGLFSSIGDAVGDVFGGIKDIVSPITGLMGIPGMDSALGFGASLLGGSMQAQGTAATNVANAKEAALNRQFQHDEAAAQREWTQYNSNTAHQRQITDLRLAGLNPILSANLGGAATAAGASAGSVGNAVMQNPYSGFGELANSARRIQEVEKERISYERDLAKERVNTEKTVQENQVSQAFNNYQTAAKSVAEAQLTSTKDAVERWGLKWLKPEEYKLLQSQTAAQTANASMNSAYAGKALTDKAVQDLELNRRSISKDIEPYTQAGREISEATGDAASAIWSIVRGKGGIKLLNK